MTRKWSKSSAALTACVVLTACGGENGVTPPSGQVLTITVTPDDTAVLVGGTARLSATVTDQNSNTVTGQTIAWASSDEAVVTINATTGVVTGVSEGATTVTATAGTLSATAAIAVVPQAAFGADVSPIFSANCAVAGCHVAPTPPLDLDLSSGVAYDNIVNVVSQQSSLDRIEPGDPQRSYLVHKVRGTQNDVGGSGLQMPRNAPALPATLINTIIAWVWDGAPQN